MLSTLESMNTTMRTSLQGPVSAPNSTHSHCDTLTQGSVPIQLGRRRALQVETEKHTQSHPLRLGPRLSHLSRRRPPMSAVLLGVCERRRGWSTASLRSETSTAASHLCSSGCTHSRHVTHIPAADWMLEVLTQHRVMRTLGHWW